MPVTTAPKLAGNWSMRISDVTVMMPPSLFPAAALIPRRCAPTFAIGPAKVNTRLARPR
jgi:hypothetical protein